MDSFQQVIMQVNYLLSKVNNMNNEIKLVKDEDIKVHFVAVRDEYQRQLDDAKAKAIVSLNPTTN